MMPGRLCTLAASLLVLWTGCPGQEVRGRADGVEKIIKNARENGAYRCAPKQLALAEANLERTRDELDLGNLMPARDHVKVADTNARLAYTMSPPERCAPKTVVAPTKLDTDGDGCLDDVDKCPKEAEDKDGFEDQDCCPDPDNDRDGIPDDIDQCANHPEDKDGFEEEDGCPDLDNDRDGIPDAQDRCPDEPEDRDGHQDEDGCPDNDNDNDKIADTADRCPNQPEDYDGDDDTDGCPDKYKLVVVTAKKIELKQRVYFATAKTRILPRSFALLDEVARALLDRKKIYVRIEGHTDSRGSNRYNRRLSQGRAASVRRYLMRKGIGPERMEAIGYGESRPLASNRTRAGRAQNRRVEFVITRQ